MRTKELGLTVAGQHVSFPEIPLGTTLHVHLHLAAPPAPDVATAAAPVAAARRGRTWTAPLLAIATLVVGYGLSSVTKGSDPSRGVPVAAAMAAADSQEAAAMRTLDRQLHQPPSVTLPDGKPTSPPEAPAAKPFGLEN